MFLYGRHPFNLKGELIYCRPHVAVIETAKNIFKSQSNHLLIYL